MEIVRLPNCPNCPFIKLSVYQIVRLAIGPLIKQSVYQTVLCPTSRYQDVARYRIVWHKFHILFDKMF